jgi:hypothetical protein
MMNSKGPLEYEAGILETRLAGLEIILILITAAR